MSDDDGAAPDRSGDKRALAEARRVFAVEAAAIRALEGRLDQGFARAVRIAHECEGKVAITGMGKSGIICRKIASTLASTGTPAFFLHPAEGLHGDLGMLDRADAVFAVSNSGETGEMLQILPLVKRLGIPLVVITGAVGSTLARAGDAVLDVSVDEEACPLGLAPTASTTATLAMGDALAMALLVRRGFREADFAERHPGGSLGRKLFHKVHDLMHVGDAIPTVGEGASTRELLAEMTAKRLGCAGVLDGEGRLVGIVTDGDLRRGIEDGGDLLGRTAGELMSPSPRRIAADELAAAALHVLETHQITQLFVHEPGDPGRVVGVLHLHDILKAGVA